MLTAIIWPLIALASGPAQETPPQAQVREASFLADGMKVAVGEFLNRTDRLPASNAEARLPDPTLIRGRYVASGTIDGNRITFEFGPGAHPALVSKHLSYEAKVAREDGRFVSLVWLCRSDDIPQELCPRSCACSGDSAAGK